MHVSFEGFFYALNVLLALLGALLVYRYALYRIVLLYGVFTLVLFWLTSPIDPRNRSHPSRKASSVMLTCAAIVVVLSLGLLFLWASQSLYFRPPSTPFVFTILITCLAAAVLTANDDRHFLLKPAFMLPAICLIGMFVEFSIYLCQPGLGKEPLYTTVDAYRDIVNAATISRLSFMRPDTMVLETYYRPFPVVPLQIVGVMLVSALPPAIAHLAIAMTFYLLALTSFWLLATSVIRRSQSKVMRITVPISLLLLILQPFMIEPMYALTPITFSIPFVTLILYLTYWRKIGPTVGMRSLSLAVMLLLAPVIPMHAASAIMVILFLAVLTRSGRSSPVLLGFISLIYFGIYLASYALKPTLTMLSVIQALGRGLLEILRSGPAILGEAAMSSRLSSQAAGVNPFLQALPMALLLSVFTIFIVRMLQRKTICRQFGSTAFACGVLSFVALGGGYAFSYFPIALNVDMRYFVYPVAPAMLTAVVIVMILVLEKANGRRKAALLVVLVLFALSTAASPLFLHESDPGYARLIPIESERAAAEFTSAAVTTGLRTQVVTDWPFYPYVQALVSLRCGETDCHVTVPNLMYVPMAQEERTVVLLRKYFMQSEYLRSVAPYTRDLEDPERWSTYDRIFDSSSVSALVSAFPA